MLLTWTILGIGFIPVSAQQLGEMKVELVPEGKGVTFIVRNPEESILMVHSTIPEMSFESNQGVISVDNPDPGEYLVHLKPGTHIITFKADGFLQKKNDSISPGKSIGRSGLVPKEDCRAWMRICMRSRLSLMYRACIAPTTSLHHF